MKNSCIKVLYDGECEMCVFIKDKAKGWGKEKFDLIDVRKDKYPTDFSSDQLLKEIHVIDEKGKVLKNIDAVFAVLEVNPRYKKVVKLGRLPLIKSILQLGYKIVAANRKFIFGKYSQIYWLKVISALAFLIGLLLSPNLWLSTRSYPLSPLVSLFAPSVFPIDILLYLALIAHLIAIIFLPKVRGVTFSFLLLFGYLVFQDQSRLQPWAYQYAFMLAIFAVFPWTKERNLQTTNVYILNTLCLLIAMIYVLSGLHKLNPVFAEKMFVWMNEPLGVIGKAINNFGYIAALGEASIGLGLIIKPFRKYAVFGALLMHIYILYTLSPLGHNWNNIVWPWNLAMMCFVSILFFNNTTNYKNIIFQNKFIPHILVFLFFVIMPLSSFLGRWDSYLSFSLYAGDTTQGFIVITENVYQNLPLKIKPYAHEIDNQKYSFDFFNLSLNEMNVLPYPEARIYRSVGYNLCKYADQKDEVQIYVSKEVRWFDLGWKNKSYVCPS